LHSPSGVVRRAARCLPVERNAEEAVKEKLSSLSGSVFGKPMIRFTVGSMHKVWAPYAYIVYGFSTAKPGTKAGAKTRTGEIALVYDRNEAHPFQYDVYEDGHLRLDKGLPAEEGWTLLPPAISVDDMKEKAEDYVRYKILLKSYATTGALTLHRISFFYRPAVEMEVIYKDRNRNLRYAWLDKYSVQNEHVSGIKHRLHHR
jgi:hypothetical protein